MNVNTAAVVPPRHGLVFIARALLHQFFFAVQHVIGELSVSVAF